ncbi:MAG: AAA family ATPase [Pseudobdellovibrionaceae bacterium]|nr:AAA family ATPase [Pseudobdellovibrionaceae bacterium]
MPIIFALCNKKGGCGKTMAAINIAAILASLGHKVLLIDADEQGNASANLGVKMLGKKLGKTLYDALIKERPLEDVIIPSEFPNLDVIVGDSQLSVINMEKTIDPGAPMLLKDWFDSNNISYYDYVIIDTNPAINLMFYIALNGSHYFMLPIFPEADSFDGVGMMFETIRKIQRKSNKMLGFLGMVITKNKEKSGTHKLFRTKIYSFCEKHGYPILGRIPDSDAVASASAAKKPLIHYRVDLPVTEAYVALVNTLLTELKPRRGRPKSLEIPTKDFEELATHEINPNEVEISFE